ncbi:MAG: hypothetical protein ABI855_16830 [Bacteroidota bacterium]
MKKIKLLKKSLILLACFTISSAVLLAQSTSKKPGIKNDGMQLKIAKNQADAKRQAEQKAKYESNGLKYHTPVASKQSNASRPCINKVTTGPSAVKRATFDHLSARAQESIKSHPEKYTIVD